MSLLIIGLCGQSVFLSVPHFHRPEETLHASALFTEPGGKGYNQAVAAARMGAKVVFAGAIGQDADGEACCARLKKEAIKDRMTRKDGQTAYAVILTDAQGENRVTVFPGTQMERGDVLALEEEFAAANMLLLTPEIPKEAFDQAVKLARKYQVPLVINPAPFFPWVKEYINDAALLTPNRSEACALLACEEAQLMEKLAAWKGAPMIVTLGKDGALCAENGKITTIPAKKANVVDTTGAGDCLNGVLCALLLEGEALETAARIAVCAASLAVESAHVLDAMPYRAAVFEAVGKDYTCNLRDRQVK